MPVRSTMAALISSVRILINDTLPVENGQVFDDQTIQDVLDESREDLVNVPLIPKPTYSGSSIQYLNYYYPCGGFEDDYVLKQYLTVTVVPSSVEPIAGHFTFSSNVFPPVYVAGKIHDRYRASADLLERWAAKVVLKFDVTVGGQTFKRAQAAEALQKLAKSYRQKQRPRTSSLTRSDLNTNQADIMGPRPIDYGFF